MEDIPIKKVAENARLNLEEEEEEEFSRDFDKILKAFSRLNEIDTEGVEPSFHPIEVKDNSREDESEESLEKEEVFSNTENEEENYFKGPRASE